MTKRDNEGAVKAGMGEEFSDQMSRLKKVWAPFNSIPSVIIPTYIPQNHFYIIRAQLNSVDRRQESVLFLS
jgi:hypothetical protein